MTRCGQLVLAGKDPGAWRRWVIHPRSLSLRFPICQEPQTVPASERHREDSANRLFWRPELALCGIGLKLRGAEVRGGGARPGAGVCCFISLGAGPTMTVT